MLQVRYIQEMNLINRYFIAVLNNVIYFYYISMEMTAPPVWKWISQTRRALNLTIIHSAS